MLDAGTPMMDAGSSDVDAGTDAGLTTACDPNPCYPGVTCTPDASAMGYMCGDCPQGYEGDGVGPTGCTDIDECAGITCGYEIGRAHV